MEAIVNHLFKDVETGATVYVESNIYYDAEATSELLGKLMADERWHLNYYDSGEGDWLGWDQYEKQWNYTAWEIYYIQYYK